MKAMRIHEDGGPEVRRLDEVEDPVAGPGEVLIRLKAASLNHLDIWLRQGLPSVPKPRILGADGAGVVEALGEGADGFELGQRVVLNPGLRNGAEIVGEHRDGTHAELIAIPRENVHPIPEELSFEEAAAFPLVYETAYRMLVTRAGLREGEWVLVWGIGSGVGSAAFLIAKALGAKVVVTSSDDGKLERASELGADETVNHESGDVVSVVKEATEGGPHVVVEHVGEATWKTSLQVARTGGRIAVCGATSGPTPGQSPPHLLEAALDPGIDNGDGRGLRGGLRAGREWSREAAGRPGVPARGGGGRPPIPRKRETVRQGRPERV